MLVEKRLLKSVFCSGSPGKTLRGASHRSGDFPPDWALFWLKINCVCGVLHTEKAILFAMRSDGKGLFIRSLFQFRINLYFLVFFDKKSGTPIAKTREMCYTKYEYSVTAIVGTQPETAYKKYGKIYSRRGSLK